MAAPFDAPWATETITDGKLNKVTIGQGTSFPSTWLVDRLFWRTDTNLVYKNIGSEGTPVWEAIGGVQGELFGDGISVMPNGRICKKLGFAGDFHGGEGRKSASNVLYAERNGGAVQGLFIRHFFEMGVEARTSSKNGEPHPSMLSSMAHCPATKLF